MVPADTNDVPVARLIGFEVKEITDWRAIVTLTAEKRHANPMGTLHGGILCDIGSHQIEQFLYFCGSGDGTILSAAVANYHHPETPELEDFGEASLVGDNGSSHYFRVDWFTPDGLSSWGDGRTIILGTEGYIELRKNVDICRDQGDQVYLVNAQGESHFSVATKIGYPFFGNLIRDCLERTDRAMSQEHIFKAAELCLKAQERAVRLWPLAGTVTGESER